MGVKVQWEVTGLLELDRALRQVREAMGGKEGNITHLALRDAAKPVIASQLTATRRHKKTGRLNRAIKGVRHSRPKVWSELYGVGVHNMGKRPYKGQTDEGLLPWYAALVEYGGRNNAGPLRGFMRRSLESNRDEVVALFKESAGRRIEQKAKKIGDDNLRAVGAKIRTGQ